MCHSFPFISPWEDIPLPFVLTTLCDIPLRADHFVGHSFPQPNRFFYEVMRMRRPLNTRAEAHDLGLNLDISQKCGSELLRRTPVDRFSESAPADGGGGAWRRPSETGAEGVVGGSIKRGFSLHGTDTQPPPTESGPGTALRITAADGDDARGPSAADGGNTPSLDVLISEG